MSKRLVGWGAAVARACGSLMIAASSLALTPSAQASEVRLSSSLSSVQLGDIFTLRVGIYGLRAGAGDSLSAFDLHLDHAASASFLGADFEDASLGLNALALPEAGAFPFLGEVTQTQPGRLNAFGLSGNSQDFLDAQQASSFVFLNLHFRALAQDAAALFSLDLQDSGLLFAGSDGERLSPDFGTSRLSLQFLDGGLQVPEPPMLGLVGAALLLGGLRRRAAALAATGLLLGAGAASAQTAPAAMPPDKPAATVQALVIEVQGQRLKLLDAQGRETWYTLRQTPPPGLAGKRIQGQVSAQGDSLVLEPTRID